MDVKKAISLLSLKRDVACKLQESWKDVKYCPPDGVVASAELFSCQYKDYADALDLAISVLELMPEVKEFNFRKVTKLAPMLEAGEPLSLEQLKQMDGKPVWIVEYPDWGHWELSEDANDYIVDRNLDFYGMKHDDPDGRYGLHKLGWFAYPYPPAHIDVKVFCGNWEGEADGYADGELVYDVWRCGDCGHVEETDDPDLLPRFCPRCGRAMTPEAWTELERRLRG